MREASRLYICVRMYISTGANHMCARHNWNGYVGESWEVRSSRITTGRQSSDAIMYSRIGQQTTPHELCYLGYPP